MNKIILSVIACFILTTLYACETNTSDEGKTGSSTDSIQNNTSTQNEIRQDEIGIAAETSNQNSDEISIMVTVGNTAYPAKLYRSEAANAFISLFPLTVDMSDLNGNEKYHYLPQYLSSGGSESPSTINGGDIMCWSGNCLVLFYEDFSNSYGAYDRLGYIENTTGLAEVLGSGDIRVTFSYESSL